MSLPAQLTRFYIIRQILRYGFVHHDIEVELRPKTRSLWEVWWVNGCEALTIGTKSACLSYIEFREGKEKS